MNTITLPRLERIVFQQSGCKNKIIQLISPPIDLPFHIVASDKSTVTIDVDGIKYCFTSNKNIFSDDTDCILLTNQKPTEERLRNQSISVIKWLKHPLLKEYSTEEIISSWENDFCYKEENPNRNIQGLRTPQIGALHALLGHLKLPLDTATVVLPTGTGKTETMLAALVTNPCKCLLVTVPSNSLRNQIFEKFETFGLLKKFEVIGGKSLYPIVGIIKEKFESRETLQQFFEKCNVIVTTLHLLVF